MPEISLRDGIAMTMEPIITPDHIRKLWDAGIRGERHGTNPSLFLTPDGRLLVADRPNHGSAIIITIDELRNYTRGRFTAAEARDIASALTEELRMASIEV